VRGINPAFHRYPAERVKTKITANEGALPSADKAGRFNRIVVPHLDAAYNYARWLTRNSADAEDVAHEALLRALQFFDSFNREQVRPWLLAIVRNTFYTWLKKTRPLELAEPFNDDSPGAGGQSADPSEEAILNADRRALSEAIERLPREFREPLILRELEELSYQEIATILEIPIGTVMSRLARARQRLTQAIAGGQRKDAYHRKS
jgi:RNA polymerase sigma factor (sigma-70 family)